MDQAGLLAAAPLHELVFFINKALLAGIIIGSIYALGAVGVTLIFGILRFAHFPHGDMMTAGAFFALVLATQFPSAGSLFGLPTAFVLLPIAMAATSLFAIGIDCVVYRPLRASKAKPIVIVMASVGTMLMLQGLVRVFAGTATRELESGPKTIFRFPVGDGMIVLTEPQILLIALTTAAAILLHLFLTHSRAGKAMRAMADNPDLARISGISTANVTYTVWVIAGSLAAAAGTLLALDVTLKPDLSYNLLLPIFAAAIVGGIGRPFGALAGGMLVGFAETLAVFNWAVIIRPLSPFLEPYLELPNKISLVPTEYKLVIPFLILVIALIWRPTGLFRGSKVLA